MISEIIVISFLTTIIFLILLRPLSIKFNVVDRPNSRKKHHGSIPLIGGICIFGGILTSQIYLQEFDKTIISLLLISLIILILGIIDDIINLKARKKLFVQIVVVTFTIYIIDLKVNNLDYLFGPSFALELGLLSIPFTLIAVIGLTNAFNMIDGIDGLAAGLIIIAIIGILLADISFKGNNLNIVLLTIISCTVAFLLFNMTSNNNLKVFLGDGGSLFLGFWIAMVLIYKVENLDNFSPTFALWCVAIPLFDFFGVMFLRKIERRPLMLADRDHIHHFLESFNLSKKSILLLLISFGFLILIIGYILDNNIPAISFPIFIFLFVLYLCFRFYFRNK